MLDQGRSALVTGFCLCLFFSCNSLSQIHSQEMLITESVFPEWFEDARLNDVQFIDSNIGFAIGERGLILSTIDGGEVWKRIPQRINCSLNSIHFVDTLHGWIVGGYEIPNYPATKGVVLRTMDGGQTWKQLNVHSVPQMRWCQFTSAKHGWAVGDDSPSHPSGIMETHDGGRTWSSFVGIAPSPWRTAGLSNNENGRDPSNSGIPKQTENQATGLPNAAGLPTNPLFPEGSIRNQLKQETAGSEPLQLAPAEKGAFRFLKSRIERSVFTSSRKSFSVHAMEMMDRKSGFAVGDKGHVAATRNSGVSWDVVDPLTSLTPENFPVNIDLRTVESTENAIWVAGNPGSYVYRLDRVKNTWSRHRTGVTSAIRRINFVHDQLGWAVGDMGTILCTNDGGQTWSSQRGASSSLAILHIASSSEQLSPEFLTKYTTENNLRCGALIFDSSQSGDRTRQALSRLGISQITLCDRSAGQMSEVDLKDYLVRQIRSCRPQIIIVESDDSRFVANVTSAASETANERIHTEHFTDQGLAPWMPKFVLQANRGENVASKIASQQFLTRVGRRLDDHLEISRGLLTTPGQPNPHRSNNTEFVGLMAILSNMEGNYSFSDLYNTLKTADVNISTRGRQSPSRGNLAMMRASAKKSQIMERLGGIRQTAFNNNRIQGISQALIGLDDLSAGVWLHQLGNHYADSGKFELAAETFALLSIRYKEHPMLYTDLKWLWKYYSSDELGNLQIGSLTKQYETQKEQVAARPIPAAIPKRTVQDIEVHDGHSKVIWKPIEASAESGSSVATVSFDQMNERSRQLLHERYLQSQRVTISLERLDFDAFEYPEIKLASLRLNDKLSTAVNTTGQYKAMLSSDNAGIARGANRELQLARGPLERERLVETSMVGKMIDTRPKLDGILDESFWQTPAPSHALQGPLSQIPGIGRQEFRICADDQFIYFAVKFQKFADRDYSVPDSPRSRDPDLANSDRLMVRLDTDRDYQTWFELTFDSRGWVSENCCQNPNWNPDWYVARNQTDDEWVIEAALPIRELLPVGSTVNGQTWAISLERYNGSELVGKHPALADKARAWDDKTDPNHFDLLFFQEEPAMAEGSSPLRSK